MDLTKSILQTIIKHNLLQRGDVVLLGVSGGADSVCLLYILNSLKHRLGVQLHIAHYNHRLRLHAKRDEDFVKSLAMKLNLPITIGERKGVLENKTFSEDHARQLRFQFLAQTAKRVKARVVGLAHHQNDLAETVLMRLLRGSGISGLKGILIQNQIGKESIIRPLLNVSRSKIEEYLDRNKLKYCKDETNIQTKYLRNKIRLRLLPHLAKEYNPKISSVLLDLASSAGDDYDYLLLEGRRILNKLSKGSSKKIVLEFKDFSKQHVSMQRMLLRLSFEKLTGSLNQLSFSHIQEVQDSLSAQLNNFDVHWPKRVTVSKMKNQLILSI